MSRALDPPRQSAPTPAKARRPQHRLTDAESVALALDYRHGTDMKDLAIQFGVHRTTVRACLDRLGVPLRQAGIAPADHAEVVRLYRDGWSLVRLAEKFDCSPNTVQRVLIEAGVRRRAPWERG